METLGAYAAIGREGFVWLRSMLPLVSEDSARTWIHAAKVGAWKGHPTGEFEFSRKSFDKMIANFNKQVNPAPLYYEHTSPGAGWVHKLERRGDDLYAFVEFTDAARDQIKGGIYRFCSVGVSLDSIDRESGENVGAELFEISLTNQPFIDGLAPIKLSRRVALAKGTSMSDAELLSKAMEELGSDKELAEYMEWVEANREAEPEVEASEEEAQLELETPEQEMLEGEPDAAMPEAALATMQALASAMEVELPEMLAAIEANMEAVMAALAPEAEAADEATLSNVSVSVLNANNEALRVELNSMKERIAELENEKLEAEHELLVSEIDAAVEQGVFLSAARDELVAQARKSPEALRAVLKLRSEAVAVPPQGSVYKRKPSKDSEKAEVERLKQTYTYQLNKPIHGADKALELARSAAGESN